MAIWEKVLIGIFALVIIFLFVPGINQRLKNSPKADRKEWLSLLVPLGLVILFVMLLIMLSR